MNESKKRPNILWILAEDTSIDLSCYGCAGVKTPNLDRLANEGVRFTNILKLTDGDHFYG